MNIKRVITHPNTTERQRSRQCSDANVCKCTEIETHGVVLVIPRCDMIRADRYRESTLDTDIQAVQYFSAAGVPIRYIELPVYHIARWYATLGVRGANSDLDGSNKHQPIICLLALLLNAAAAKLHRVTFKPIPSLLVWWGPAAPFPGWYTVTLIWNRHIGAQKKNISVNITVYVKCTT